MFYIARIFDYLYSICEIKCEIYFSMKGIRGFGKLNSFEIPFQLYTYLSTYNKHCTYRLISSLSKQILYEVRINFFLGADRTSEMGEGILKSDKLSEL